MLSQDLDHMLTATADGNQHLQDCALSKEVFIHQKWLTFPQNLFSLFTSLLGHFSCKGLDFFNAIFQNKIKAGYDLGR